MDIHCPNGYQAGLDIVANVGGEPVRLIFGEKVEIMENVCDHGDLCGIKDCPYNAEGDKEAIGRSIKRSIMKHDLTTGIKKEEERKSILYEKLHSKGLKVIK